MNKFNLKPVVFFVLVTAISLSSCRAIESIFKAGVWVGVIAVVLVIAIILWLISKLGKK